MPKKERALPQPPRKKTGPGFSQEEETGGLVFDKLQEAMAEGRMEEFMKENMPEGQHARKLVEIMMGMSGGGPFTGKMEGAEGNAPNKTGANSSEAGKPPMKVPKDVLQAAMEGNVGTLADLLKREHGEPGPQRGKKKTEGGTIHKEGPLPEEKNVSLLEKEIMDSLLEIAVDNNLDMDWLIYRALKLYIKKYRETGQL